MNLKTTVATVAQITCFMLVAHELHAQSPITQVTVRIKTARSFGSCGTFTCDGPPSGTDSTVYLGINGREFNLDRPGDDFGVSSDNLFVLGESANVLNASRNDPRGLASTSLSSPRRFPVYIRMSELQDDDWWVDYVEVRMYSNGVLQATWTAAPLQGIGDAWLRLGRDFGCRLFLSRLN